MYIFCTTQLYAFTITSPTSPDDSSTDTPATTEATSIDPNVNYNAYYQDEFKNNVPFQISYLGYGNPRLDPLSPLAVQDNYQNPADVALEFKSAALFYPNPFSLTLDSPQIGFKISKDTENLDIQIYDMRGLKVFDATFQDKALGPPNYNKFTFSAATFAKPIPNLSSGVYIFLILNEGNVLSEGKFVIKP